MDFVTVKEVFKSHSNLKLLTLPFWVKGYDCIEVIPLPTPQKDLEVCKSHRLRLPARPAKRG